MAQAIIGGLSASVILTIFIVPAAYLLIYQRTERQTEANPFNA
jgi:Cu/Ag efflux pump CusA